MNKVLQEIIDLLDVEPIDERLEAEHCCDRGHDGLSLSGIREDSLPDIRDDERDDERAHPGTSQVQYSRAAAPGHAHSPPLSIASTA